MLYIVEMDLPERDEIDRWHAWYDGHIAKLLTVEGYHGAQRFEALSPTPSPFLAVHAVDGPEVFESRAYLAVGGPTGTGEWRDKMTNWHRNLFQGCNSLGALASEERLALVADGAKLDDAVAKRVIWLTNAGLDQSIPQRGLIILEVGEDADAVAGSCGVVLYRPITKKMTKTDA